MAQTRFCCTTIIEKYEIGRSNQAFSTVHAFACACKVGSKDMPNNARVTNVQKLLERHMRRLSVVIQ